MTQDEKTTDPSSTSRAETSRINGTKSHGPTSATGKLNSRRNALTHGQTAKILTLERESDDSFIEILSAIEAQLQPQNELEDELVETIAYNRWRTMRTWSNEKAVIDTAMSDVHRASHYTGATELPNAECGGIALRNLADQSRVLAIIDRNENRYQRFYHRALREFFTLRDREQKAKCKTKNDKTNPVSPSKQSQPQKTNPANPEPSDLMKGPSDLMKGWRDSKTLEARIAANREQKRQADQSSVGFVETLRPLCETPFPAPQPVDDYKIRDPHFMSPAPEKPQLEKVYEPRPFETHWAQWWVETGLYNAKLIPGKPVFSLVIPPPNVTGSLHMGHMLEHAEIDVTVRWHRMLGESTLWLPGTDHAGIATEMIVSRQLQAKGIYYRRDLTREEFEAKVWEWKAESGGTIKRQMIQIGDSCDWSRERFTYDPGLSRAVREVFVNLYERDLIYRGEYMVNWCPECNTAISDVETVHEETAGHMWHIRYGAPGTQQLVVATTRPETMLGDTAVAINARDERYKHLHGQTLRLPLMDRDIPIILDDMADPEFGSGAVKITPAHDPNDFEAGKRHNLPSIQVIGQDGRMTAAAGKYAGLDRFEARERIVEDLHRLGLLESIQDHTLSIGKCSRSKTVIEPLVSKQWFVRTKPLAAKAIAAVDEKRIEIVPEVWVKTWNEWMHNIRDWCISRQLWWGHRIPVWYCDACNFETASREDITACPKCQGALRQDPDVLDTWFSSGIWPFSTLGWPDKTEDLKTFYPTTLLITGFDILFFWVARMAMLGIEFMGDVPFKQVYIHGLVRDAEKQKMSKTKGNVIDPLVVTEEYGTDAVRMAILGGAAPGTDIVFTTERIETARAFANKIWNAARFILSQNLERDVPPAVEDRWIRSRLNQCADEMNRAIGKHRYHEAANIIWHFIYDDFCDWYIELKKVRSTGFYYSTAVFEATLKLLHPLMPFITEEIWHRILPREGQSISTQAYPQFDPANHDPSAEREIALLQSVIVAVRGLRADLSLDPKLPLTGTISIPVDFHTVERLTRVTFTIGEVPKTGAIRNTADFDLALEVPQAQMEAQKKRIEKELEQLEKNIANCKRQLSDETFMGKAPAKIVESIRAKLAEYEKQWDKLKS